MANLINSNTAGIDIASNEHYVAVPKDRAQQNVRVFRSFTRDLHDLAAWLKECKIETVAMESTGVYWFHLFTILEDQGFEVYLVNARHVKNVPGRKSDISDAQWIQQLHSFGLLKNCFQPDNLTRRLRNYIRQRKQIIQDMTTQTQRMQKALEQMNIKLGNVIRDIQGKTGRAIINSILKGERSPEVLAEHRDPRIKCSRETLIKSLEGNWREEQLFNLERALEYYNFLESQLHKYDKESEKVMQEITTISQTPVKKNKAKKQRIVKNQPKFDTQEYLYQIYGVDVMQIYGFKSTTALTVLSETGPFLKEKFPSDKQFLSWLNVVPDNQISGGKVLSSRVRKKKNKAGQAFRDAANTLWNAKNPLGDYLRRKKTKAGKRQAVVSTARKIASMFYTMVTEKVEFDPHKINNNLERYLINRAKTLERKLLEAKRHLADFECVTG